MADTAVGFLLENLNRLLLHHADLIHGIEHQVLNLQEDLLRLKSFTHDYGLHRRRTQNEILKVSMKQIKKLLSKAEDAVDSSLLQALEHKSKSQIEKVFYGFDYASKLRRSAKEIEIFREKIKDLTNIWASEFNAVKDEWIFNDRKEPVVEEENVVGMDKEAKTLISHLMGGSKHLNVVFITGMPGIGKTTLAKKVFNDEKIRREFDTCVFTYISQEYDLKKVFLDILGSFSETTREMYNMSDYTLAEVLHDNLKGRKFFIILDDVWTEDTWDNIRVAFPYNEHGRVLVTSQKISVSRSVNASYSYNMRFLTLEESRELLRKKLFGKKCFPLDLEEFEFHIAQNCRGLPLAIVAIAELLVDKRNRTEWWKKAQENANFYVMLYQERTLSFNNLPDPLKLCFLYLSFFPEDFEIPVWKLFRLWIAEGFILMNENANLEHTAGMYLDYLVNRNLVLVKKRKSNGVPKTCQIHDTLRELCKKAAVQENVFHEIIGDSYVPSNPLSGYQRRIFVNSSVLEYISSEPSGVHIRSFLSFAQDETIFPERLVSSFTKAFKLLRVFDIKSISFTHFPSELCQLILLKYVAISGEFKSLPRELSNLWNIQTLLIETSMPVLVIEADIWEMLWLRHLHTNVPAYLPCCPAKTSKNEEASAQLQTLSRISPESCREEVFVRTSNLKKLGICGKLSMLLEEEKSSFLNSLGTLCSLENLKLLNDDASFKLHGLPEVRKFPQKLRELTLSNTSLDWKHISTLARLENLEVLKLKDNAFIGELWQTEDGGFRTLKVLHIRKTNLEIWKASAHHFPELRYLVLRQCGELKSIPSNLADISRLQIIELCDTNPSVISSARKIQLLKLQNQAKQGTDNGWFKLAIDAIDPCSFER